MTDSQRLKTIPEGIRIVSEVAGELARRGEGRTSVLAATTFLPMDVDSVARVFEGFEEVEGVTRIQEGGRAEYEIGDPERFVGEGPRIDADNYLEGSEGFLKAVSALKLDEDWVRKVQEQHELLYLVGQSGKTTLELGYLTRRVKWPRARVQSILNDFNAEGFIEVEIDEEGDEMTYHFPALEYSKARYERNLAYLQSVEPAGRGRVGLWILLVAVGLVILLLVVLLRT